MNAPPLKIAIQGCCHGELNRIYASLPADTDLLLIGGDFQAIRTHTDLETLNVPNKYKQLGDFPSYYAQSRLAPILTIFIGGNHECSSYLQELKYGGWVARNIYYLGEFGSVWFRGVHICGWSGIFNHSTFVKNECVMERLPFDQGSIRSVYHQKLPAFVKLCMMNHDLDVVMSHDWPVGVEKYGDMRGLLRRKPFFREDIEKGQLGSPLNKFLLHYLRPRYWYSAHLHVKFKARVEYKQEKEMVENNRERISVVKNDNVIDLDMDDEDVVVDPINKDEVSLDMDDDGDAPKNKDELALDMDDDDTDTKDPPSTSNFEHTLYLAKTKPCLTRASGGTTTTDFLALDKCGKGGNNLEINYIKIMHPDHPSVTNPGKLYYSKRAIAINQTVENYLKSHANSFRGINTRTIVQDPSKVGLVSELMPLVELQLNKLDKRPDDDFIIPEDFKQIKNIHESKHVRYYPNNQTERYCQMFDVEMPDCLNGLRWEENTSDDHCLINC